MARVCQRIGGHLFIHGILFLDVSDSSRLLRRRLLASTYQIDARATGRRSPVNLGVDASNVWVVAVPLPCPLPCCPSPCSHRCCHSNLEIRAWSAAIGGPKRGVAPWRCSGKHRQTPVFTSIYHVQNRCSLRPSAGDTAFLLMPSLPAVVATIHTAAWWPLAFLDACLLTDSWWCALHAEGISPWQTVEVFLLDPLRTT